MEAETKVIHTCYCQTITPDLFKMSVMVFPCDKVLYWPEDSLDLSFLHLQVTLYTSEVSEKTKGEKLLKGFILFVQQKGHCPVLCSVVFVQSLAKMQVYSILYSILYNTNFVFTTG